MMDKFMLSIGIVLVLAIGFVFFGFAEPPRDAVRAGITGNSIWNVESADLRDVERFAIYPDRSHFEFEGYGPGKSHVGTFDEFEGELYFDKGMLVGFGGVIKAESVNTGIGRLNGHLKGRDFFDAETYPEIGFVSTELDDDILTGILDFHGVQREVSFPVVIIGDEISADFILNTAPFGMNYPGVDKEVRIAFELNK